VCSFTESYFSDTDNTVLLENTTPINENKKVKIKERRAGYQINQNGIFKRCNVVNVR